MSRNRISSSRRRFLGLAGAAAGGALVAPYIGGVRRANAARGSAIACIRIFLSGGARTSALWDAGHSKKYAPYGAKYSSPPSGVDPSFFIGSLWPDELVDVMQEISVVRTVHHNAGTSHSACRQRMLTGGTDPNLPGWTTVLNRELFAPLPAIHIGDANDFAEQLGSLGPTFSSIEIPNARAIDDIRTKFLAGLPSEFEMRRIAKLRDALSLRRVQRSPSASVRDLPFQQGNTKEIIEQITTGAQFDVTSSGDGASVGRRISDGTSITNAQLRAAFDVDAGGRGSRYGSSAMLALRLVQSGLRSVNIEEGGWDTHSNEERTLTAKIPELGRMLATLISTLKNMESMTGRADNALDEVLIILDTEFSRDNTDDQGFNGSAGSDHQSKYAKYISVMFAGGGVAGGRAIGATDENFEPVNGKAYLSSRINATIYDLLGVSSGKYIAEPPIEELYT